MLSEILRKLTPMLGLSLVLASGCIKSVCENDSDCPSGKFCDRSGANICQPGCRYNTECLTGYVCDTRGEKRACVRACSNDGDCPAGKFCDKGTTLCEPGCRSDADCPSDNTCVKNKCWPVISSLPQADAGSEDDAGTLVCSCLRAPRACLVDINPSSSTSGATVCEPSDPPRATAMFFGNVGCSHCQNIFSQLLEIESQLRSEGLDATLAFVQLNTWDYTGEQVTSTFPTHRGPVLQDTTSTNLWEVYGADWYEVKIIDTHGCLSAFFAPAETMNLISSGHLTTAGTRMKEAWRSAMSSECHVLPDASVGSGL